MAVSFEPTATFPWLFLQEAVLAPSTDGLCASQTIVQRFIKMGTSLLTGIGRYIHGVGTRRERFPLHQLEIHWKTIDIYDFPPPGPFSHVFQFYVSCVPSTKTKV